MEQARGSEIRQCPKCGQAEGQSNFGYNRSGTQRCKCKNCGRTYTIAPKSRAYAEEIRQQAIKIYYSGVSGRGVGKILGMGRYNVYNWIKKTGRGVDKSKD
jgi:transposase-like protein